MNAARAIASRRGWRTPGRGQRGTASAACAWLVFALAPVAGATDAGVAEPPPAAGEGRSDSEAPVSEAPPSDGPASDAPAHNVPASDAPAPSLEPPVLVEFVPATYPPEAAAQGLAGRVGLRLTIDVNGRVTQVEVTEPAGHGFDEAARDAASRFVFAPAGRGGTPIAARIPYTYVFEPSAPAPAPLPEAPAAAAATPPPPPAPAAPSPPPVAAPRAALDVTVTGASEARQLEQSAEAVHVIETTRAQRQSADLGEVLARSEGVGVRRGGGLGSTARFSLNGLTDDQIRFFLDGVPLEFAGYPFGIANVPVNHVERVEIYRGVVPVRFGADALGGAVNLVSDDDVRGTHGSAAYQTGSFGTHRLSLGARHLHEPSGWFTRVGGFVDRADNDYPIDVEVPDERGRLSPARVYRFHDAYQAWGANVETGIVGRPWAKRLLLRTFITDYDKELQHNTVMTVPYGGVEYGETSIGASLRYAQVWGGRLSLDAVAGYTYGRLSFVDASSCVYSWFGQCVNERAQPGEIETPARDQLIWDHSVFARINLELWASAAHTLRLASAPSFVTRSGDERLQADPNARDPLTSQRDLLTWVNGLEYELASSDDSFEGIAFVKDYLQIARSEEPLPGAIVRDRDRDTHRLGVGASLRQRWSDWFLTKLSYEWATRLPRPDEVFGDAVLITDNLELRPEVSHNLNASAAVDSGDTPSGNWQAQLGWFLRDADQLIVLLGNDRVFSYQNVYGARSHGIEAAAGWAAPGDVLALSGNLTYQSFRNTSSDGTFGDFEGDRIPNRPYLFANGAARWTAKGVSAPNDELSLAYDVRYVHEFFRGWESVGLREFKQTVDSQLTHAVALTYLVRGEPLTLSFSAEVQNLTDEKAFDFYGVQRPGRASYFKATAEF